MSWWRAFTRFYVCLWILWGLILAVLQVDNAMREARDSDAGSALQSTENIIEKLEKHLLITPADLYFYWSATDRPWDDTLPSIHQLLMDLDKYHAQVRKENQERWVGSILAWFFGGFVLPAGLLTMIDWIRKGALNRA